MEIIGAESLTRDELLDELDFGGKLIQYSYCISLIAVTLRCSSPIFFIPPERGYLLKGWPYTLMTLLLGWWGLPWGLLYTPKIILMNLGGGEDVTEEIRVQLRSSFAHPWVE